MDKFDYSELQRLVDEEDYTGAEAFCLAALDAGLDPQFGETQLGYVYFLNDEDLEAHYVRTVEVFERLVQRQPQDVNARFWLGYVLLIVSNDTENSKIQLREALALKPTQSQANLVLAGLSTGEESIALLRQALKEQPNNFRVLRQLAEILFREGRKDDAREALRTMLVQAPYIEQSYGIMNRYMNDVLTGATHAEIWRQEARSKLDQLG